VEELELTCCAGTRKVIVWVRCRRCFGEETVPTKAKCEKCSGSKLQRHKEGHIEDCECCEGTGKKLKKCPACGGEG
jgi:primosomal protein N'